ncbi:MAG TPA: SCO family protein [Rhizomicrobium sp.]|nr:SCO family protein [Rhizomicrobium sp.]
MPRSFGELNLGALLRERSRALVLLLFVILAACGRPTTADTTDITGVMPPLAFAMVRVNDGAQVSAADYRGKIVLLYFGYTHCPDECPTTLANLAATLKRLGHEAGRVRVLFVTVDPARDSLAVLKSYVAAFAPQIDGLRGSENAVAALARRYRVIYSVTPATSARPYAVMHSDSLYAFDASGHARFVTLSTSDTATLAARIAALMGNN